MPSVDVFKGVCKVRANCCKTPEIKSKRIKPPEDKVVASSVFTNPPANVYGVKGGHGKDIKCKYECRDFSVSPVVMN